MGRAEALALLEQALDRARTGVPQRVLVEGRAGIGKTALVRRFMALAGVPRVLYAEGAEAESGLAFGVLGQLLADGPGTPADGGGWADSPAAGAGLIEVIDEAQGPGGDVVTVVVDDAQWADHPSLQALTFAVRRLRADRVVAIVVVRDIHDLLLPEGLRRLWTAADAVRIRLEGLAPAELRLLSRGLGTGRLTARAAARLHTHTAGNPLHAQVLLEQAGLGLLDDLERSDSTLPAPKSFTALVLARLSACTPATEALVSAASVLGVRGALDAAAVLAGQDNPLPALEQAVSAGLLTERVGDHVVCFPHPLIHAAVYHQLGPARRAALHLRAADLTGDESLALRHRARAATGPDRALAGDLTALGRRLAAERAWSSAAGQLSTAARLSPDRAAYEQLTLEAVECRLLAGEVPDTAEAAQRIQGFTQSAWRSYLLGRLTLSDMDRSEALLHDAWNRCDPETEPVLGARIAGQFAALYGSMLRGDDQAEWAQLALRLAPDSTATDMIRFLAISGQAMSGRAPEALSALGRLADPAVASPAELELLMGRAVLRGYTDDLPGAVRDLTGVLGACHSRSAMFRVIAATILAWYEYQTGHWDDSMVHCDLALSLAADTDQPHIAFSCHMNAALVRSARGEWVEAAGHARVTREYAASGHPYPVVQAALSAAYLARARGRPEEVVAALEPLLALGRRGPFEEPGMIPWPDLLADAWTALGEHKRAEEALGPYEELAAERAHHGTLALAARSRGTLEAAQGDAAAAERAFQAAHGHAEHTRAPFDRALLHLAHGQFLRRAGKRTLAGGQLRAAREILVRLDAKPDLECCERELAACGLETGERRTRGAALLTPQELAVARRAASGLTNRQVARELVISVKTVEYHLGRLYPKLGIDSRHQLASRLADAQD
ncbi:AAA family ATPase [Streptomyces sp. NPDC051954]|uniref:AAA family ATPase n=1 Tax=unclassified Streptomyces TaxID=2593676 RepID=UPI0034395888